MLLIMDVCAKVGVFLGDEKIKDDVTFFMLCASYTRFNYMTLISIDV